ncbi:PLDc N-terminal domain-containing protein [Anaerobacillus sp. HL2]|nr:PLDc N-terminal domain-containing protein [Anaerobacillus sp. HL2]
MKNYWEGWLVGGVSLFFFICFFYCDRHFLENRNPSKTVTWLVVAIFPVIGFFSI